MKKLSATILIALLAMPCLVAFVGCNKNDNGKYGDNFVGAISQSTYDSVEDAVKGFLEEEISGQAFTAEYVGYTKTAELSKKEIDELAIDEELKDSIVSVEKGEVEYIEQFSNKTELLTKLTDETCKRTVYIVHYIKSGEKTYRFYVPSIKVGQTLTASALHSLIQLDKYYNCTIEHILIPNEEESQSECFKFSNNTLYFKVGDDYTYEKRETYMLDYQNKLVSVGKARRGNDFSQNYWDVEYYNNYFNESINSTKDMIDCQLQIIFSKYGLLDDNYCGYLVKTDKGYKSRATVTYNGGYVEYYLDDYEIMVYNGNITEISYKMIGMRYIPSENFVKQNNTIIKLNFSNFDTTKVDVPQEAMDAVKAYVENN